MDIEIICSIRQVFSAAGTNEKVPGAPDIITGTKRRYRQVGIIQAYGIFSPVDFPRDPQVALHHRIVKLSHNFLFISYRELRTA
jgi:hypothetical protein